MLGCYLKSFQDLHSVKSYNPVTSAPCRTKKNEVCFPFSSDVNVLKHISILSLLNRVCAFYFVCEPAQRETEALIIPEGTPKYTNEE